MPLDDSPVPSPPKGQQRSIDERIKRAFEARNYELLGELGRGGMGVVYLAQHKKLGRRVALKTLTPDRQTKESSILRFQREARTFAQIRHPHIATLYEYEDNGPIQYLALEYIEGTDLERERRKRRKWSAEEVAKIVASVADALDHTHQKHILHRDIKPANILIERGTNRVVLTDFGLAKGEQDDTLTATGFAVGTPAYMAPEQITDQFGTKPDGRADIFSLGTVAYEMLTHHHPFLAPDDLNTMRNIVNRPAKPLKEQDPSVPPELARIIESMLVKNPRDRVADAATVAAELAEWLKDPTRPARKPEDKAPYSPKTPMVPSQNEVGGQQASASGSANSPATAPAQSAPSSGGNGIPRGKFLVLMIIIGVSTLVVGAVLGALIISKLM